MKTLVLYIFLFLSYITIAQEPVQISITEKDGLLSNEVYAMEEDSNGFVWMATNKGLLRYDGTSFKTYSHPEQRGLSIFEPFIDNQGRVWCMNISGQIFYAQDEKFELFIDLKDELNGSPSSITVINGKLYLSYFLKFIIVDLETKKVITFPIDKNLGGFGFNYLYKEQVIFTMGNYLYTSTEDDINAMIPLPKGIIDLKKRPIPFLLQEDDNDGLFIFNYLPNGENHLFYSNNQKEWVEYKLPEEIKVNRVTTLQYFDNHLWLATSSGLLQLELKDDKAILKSHLLTSYFTTDLFQDADRNLWTSTLRNGLIIIPNIHVQRLKLPNKLPKRLKKKNNTELLIGFENGKVHQYKTDVNKFTEIPLESKTAVTAIYCDSIYQRDFIFQKLQSYVSHNDSFIKTKQRLANVKNIDVSTKNRVLYANSGELGVIDLTAAVSIDGYLQQEFLIKKRGYTVLNNSKTKLQYYATVDELIVRDQNNVIKPIKTNDDKDVLTKNLVQDRDGLIYAGTFKNGIYVIDRNQVIEHISTENVLTSNVINSLTIDGVFLWICTDRALHKYNTKTKTWQTLTDKDGVPSFSIIDMQVLNNYIYINTFQDVYTIEKNKAFKPLFIPETYITSVAINDTQQQLQDSYTLQNDKSNISISFNANGLRGLSNGVFEYRLKDQTDWITQPQGNNQIQFATLPVGLQNFELREIGNGTIKKLSFNVLQPFYTTYWFWLFFALLIIGGIVWYYRRKLRFRESEKNKQLSQMQQDKEMINLKLENLRSQMNPHFVFNALNSIQDYIVRNHKNLASDYLGKFADLIRTYLEHSVKSTIPLSEEIETLHMYLELEKLRFEDKLHYQVKLDSNIAAARISIPTMLVQPYVENALKHGLLHKKNDRKLDILFHYSQKKEILTATVIDNGVGRKMAQDIKNRSLFKKDSFATKATEDRLRLLNYGKSKNIGIDIIDLFDDKNAIGTKVIITIPHKIKGYESDYN